jgi:pimeloyl-ACP methyl ester carboxylesterase
MANESTILLIHGAWHGSWCWERTAEILRARAWEVRAIDLPTVHSERKVDLTLADDVASVADAIAGIDGPITVVAHSYGGVPATQAATDPRVQHIVYIAAFVLDEGESLLASVGGVAPDWWHIDGPLVTAGDHAQPARSLFYGDIDDATGAAYAAKLLPQSVRAFTDPITTVAWRNRATTYVITEQDAIFPVFAQEALADRSGSTQHRLSTSHSPFLSHPEAVADIIENAARG